MSLVRGSDLETRQRMHVEDDRYHTVGTTIHPSKLCSGIGLTDLSYIGYNDRSPLSPAKVNVAAQELGGWETSQLSRSDATVFLGVQIPQFLKTADKDATKIDV